MDGNEDQWATEVLNWWISHAKQAQTLGQPYGPSNADIVGQLRGKEHQTGTVIARVFGGTNIPALIKPTAWLNRLDFGDGLALAQRALGKLQTEADTFAHLGSSAPQMAADGLHPVIWNGAKDLWNDGHYRAAVLQAAALLNVHVQGRVQRYDVSDVVLMQQTFSLGSAEPGKPRLRWPGDDADLTVKAMRNGILWFAQGAFSAIRNPAAHGTDDLPKQEALELLATLSTLARWIDGCDILTADE